MQETHTGQVLLSDYSESGEKERERERERERRGEWVSEIVWVSESEKES